MNNYSLILQATYSAVEYALYNNDQVCSQHSLVKTSVCTDLMYNLCSILKENNLTWQDISTIIINQGPAPFTTLRGLIATVNGISFSQKIPLIAVDGLEACTEELAQKFHNFLVVLNAFGGDYYYSLKTSSVSTKGCAKVETIIDLMSNCNLTQEPLLITGNGAPLLQDSLEKVYGKNVTIDTSYNYVSLSAVAHEGFKMKDQNLPTTLHVSPLYLKTASYQPSCLV